MGHMKKSWGKTIKTILGVLIEHAAHRAVRAEARLHGDVDCRQLRRREQRLGIADTEHRQNLLVAGVQARLELHTQDILRGIEIVRDLFRVDRLGHIFIQIADGGNECLTQDHAAVDPPVLPVAEHVVEVPLRGHAGQRLEAAEKRDAHMKAGDGRHVVKRQAVIQEVRHGQDQSHAVDILAEIQPRGNQQRVVECRLIRVGRDRLGDRGRREARLTWNAL